MGKRRSAAATREHENHLVSQKRRVHMLTRQIHGGGQIVIDIEGARVYRDQILVAKLPERYCPETTLIHLITALEKQAKAKGIDITVLEFKCTSNG